MAHTPEAPPQAPEAVDDLSAAEQPPSEPSGQASPDISQALDDEQDSELMGQRLESVRLYVPEEAFEEIEELVTSASETIAKVQDRYRRWMIGSAFTVAAGFLVLLIAVPLVVGLHVGDDWGLWQWAAFLGMVIVGYVLLGAAIAWTSVAWGERRPRLYASFWAVLGLVAAGIAASQSTPGASPVEAIAGALGVFVALYVALIFLSTLVTVVARELALRGEARDPQALAAYRLTATLHAVAMDDPKLSSQSEQLHARTNWIEQAAHTIERDIVRSLHPGDPATDAWLRTLLDRIAAGVRSWKRELIAASTYSQEKVAGEIGEGLVHVARGEWGQMKQGEPVALERGPLRTRLLALATGLVWGAIPLVAFLLLQQTSYRLDGAVEDWAAVAVILWAGVSVLAVFDPKFNEKIAAMQDVTAMLPKPKP